ncbi:MAG: ISKra4 family transposase, partial [Firmicutes bacterium]|nr:ISKra4 family transposase [Bacillota bacterium]
VMRTQDLRPSTAAKQAKADHNLQSRLSPGEKSHRKRMAEVGAVYGIDPVVRIPSDILHAKPVDPTGTKKSGPKAVNQWLVASVADSMGDVIYQVLEEAERRDPKHERPWVALVDGNHAQLSYLQEEATARGINLQVFLDFIHVLECLWKAAWCSFCPPGTRRRNPGC